MILGLLLFILLVVVHEYGHMAAAKKSGVEVEEFGLGFPPRAKVLGTKNGTRYTLNWLPLGGFVKLKGEHDAAADPGSFGAASLPKKALILLAGVLMNWLAAIVILTIVALIGMPKLIDNQFSIKSDANVVRQEVFAGFVEKDSPAAQIGVSQYDRILKINGKPIKSTKQLRDSTQQHAGQPVTVEFKNGSTIKTAEVTLKNNPDHGNFGVAPGETTLVRSTWSAPIVGVGTTAQFTWLTLQGLGATVSDLFHGQGEKASQNVAGPVGIVVTLKDLAKQGFVFVLFLIGIISVSLAVMNVLPIPALDGGRLFVMMLFRIFKKPLSKETEEKIHSIGMMVLLLLVAIITVVDVKRFM